MHDGDRLLLFLICRDEEELELLKQEKQNLNRKLTELQNKTDVCCCLPYNCNNNNNNIVIDTS